MITKPTKRQQEYWDNILHDHKLGAGRGRSTLVDYRGDSNDLNGIESQVVSKKTGRKKPKRQAE